MIKSLEDIQKFNKQGLEACAASAKALSEGMQAIAGEAVEYNRKSFENTSAVAEKVMAAKSFDKAVEAQQKFAKDAFEAYVGQMNKFGELYTNAAKAAFKPFEAQVGAATGKQVSK